MDLCEVGLSDRPQRVIEAALAQVVQNKVGAAYARSDLFCPQRLVVDKSAADPSEARGHG